MQILNGLDRNVSNIMTRYTVHRKTKRKLLLVKVLFEITVQSTLESRGRLHTFQISTVQISPQCRRRVSTFPTAIPLVLIFGRTSIYCLISMVQIMFPNEQTNSKFQNIKTVCTLQKAV